MSEYTIVVIGAAGCGKTALTVSLTSGKFSNEYNPTIEEQYAKDVKVDDLTFSVTILDTAGQEEYSVLRDQYWRTGDGFLLVYDITKSASFGECEDYFQTIKKALDCTNFPVVMCGNKCDLDLDRKVQKEDAKAYAKDKEWGLFETSAKTRTNVDQAFEELVRMIHRSKTKNSKTDGKPGLDGKKKSGLLSWFKK